MTARKSARNPPGRHGRRLAKKADRGRSGLNGPGRQLDMLSAVRRRSIPQGQTDALVAIMTLQGRVAQLQIDCEQLRAELARERNRP